MSYVPEQQINTGAYLATTVVFDMARVYQIEVSSEEFKDLVVSLAETINNNALVTNLKDTGYYILEEFVTGQLFFNPASSDPNQLRPGFRKFINTGALAAGVTTVAHGLPITATWKFTRILGAASNTATLNYYPLPFAGAAGNNIEVLVTATNVVITNNSGATFTDSYVDLEYVKF